MNGEARIERDDRNRRGRVSAFSDAVGQMFLLFSPLKLGGRQKSIRRLRLLGRRYIARLIDVASAS
jgi:hypothetical protein